MGTPEFNNKIKEFENQLEVGAYCTFDGEQNWCIHENFTKDNLVNEDGEKAVESHLCNLLSAFEDDDNLNLNKMIVRPKFARRQQNWNR